MSAGLSLTALGIGTQIPLTLLATPLWVLYGIGCGTIAMGCWVFSIYLMTRIAWHLGSITERREHLSRQSLFWKGCQVRRMSSCPIGGIHSWLNSEDHYN